MATTRPDLDELRTAHRVKRVLKGEKSGMRLTRFL